MDEKISQKAVEHYSSSFAIQVADTFFAKNERINGAEILSLCEPKQINLFVLRELLKAWQQESQKLKSPYFDYQATDVKNALTVFQNTLSNHISITKENFIPLLRKSVHHTLFLILDPYDFYSDLLDKPANDFVKIEDLKNEIKYVKINNKPLEQLVQRLQEKKLEIISGNEAFALLDHILEEVNFTPEDVEAYIAKLSEVVPLSIDKIYDARAVNKPSIKITSSAPIIEKEKIPATVADNFQKITRIKDSLTINQKFMFTKMLFSGDFDIFTQAIDRIDSFDNLNQALHFMESNYSEWDKESEEYEEFKEMIEKRFA